MELHIHTLGPFGKADIQQVLWRVQELGRGSFGGSYQPEKEMLDVSDAGIEVPNMASKIPHAASEIFNAASEVSHTASEISHATSKVSHATSKVI
jgi:hypothetical protein